MSQNITIIGLGSLGKVIVHKAKDTGVNIQAIVRNSSLQKTNYDFYDIEGQLIKTSVTCNDVKSLATSSLVIITVKAFSIVDCLKQFDEFIPKRIPIVIINNGMGIKERIDRYLPHRKMQLYQAITTMAAYTNSKATYYVSEGFTYYGRMFPFAISDEGSHSILLNNNGSKDKMLDVLSINTTRTSSLELAQQGCSDDMQGLNLFERLFLDSNQKSIQHVNSIERYQREKLYLNALINPLTVKYRCLNGELLNHLDELKALFDEIMDFDEALQNQALISTSPFGLDERDTLYAIDNSDESHCHLNTINEFNRLRMSKVELSISFNRDNFFSRLIDVIHKTKANQSSMLQDYLARRPLEIEEITGFLLEQAEQLGIFLKHNRAIYLEVKKVAELSAISQGNQS